MTAHEERGWYRGRKPIKEGSGSRNSSGSSDSSSSDEGGIGNGAVEPELTDLLNPSKLDDVEAELEDAQGKLHDAAEQIKTAIEHQMRRSMERALIDNPPVVIRDGGVLAEGQFGEHRLSLTALVRDAARRNLAQKQVSSVLLSLVWLKCRSVICSQHCTWKVVGPKEYVFCAHGWLHGRALRHHQPIPSLRHLPERHSWSRSRSAVDATAA